MSADFDRALAAVDAALDEATARCNATVAAGEMFYRGTIWAACQQSIAGLIIAADGDPALFEVAKLTRERIGRIDEEHFQAACRTIAEQRWEGRQQEIRKSIFLAAAAVLAEPEEPDE